MHACIDADEARTGLDLASKRYDQRAAAARGLAYTRAAASAATPKYSQSDVIAPTAVYGLDATATLKATFWDCMIEETPQAGDPDFVSIALNTGGGRVWRNREKTPTAAGAIAMQPFEGAHWRFEYPVSFVHLYAPFGLLGTVCQSLYERDLGHADLRMLASITDDRLCTAAEHVQRGLRTLEPTNLILDSWALMLSEIMVRRFSSHSERPVRGSFGRLPARGIAHVVDFIEAGIDQDLRLASLAGVAGMSVFHFAKRFRETVGVSPHAYVLFRRIRRAEGMLRRNKDSLADIAAACGFASQAHFTTAFQRDSGVTPGEFRRAVGA
jgi:AraC family transcriptional regulator